MRSFLATILIFVSLLSPCVYTQQNFRGINKEAPPITKVELDESILLKKVDISGTVYVNGESVGSLLDFEPVTLISFARGKLVNFLGKEYLQTNVIGEMYYKVYYKDIIKYLPMSTQFYDIPSGMLYTYSDETCGITVYKEWYENAYVYSAHIKFTDYKRFGVYCAKGKYNSGREKTSAAAKRMGAILCVNADYAIPSNGAGGYAIARNGVVCNDKSVYCEGIYNHNDGILAYRTHNNCAGKKLSEMVSAGKITDTFQFGPAFLLNGEIVGVNKASTDRAQRTFIGSNGEPGDIWVCVSDGRYNDGLSAGLNGYQCANYLKSKGCVFGIPLDGGGSSTFAWNGVVLNAAKKSERAVVDFICFK